MRRVILIPPQSVYAAKIQSLIESKRKSLIESKIQSVYAAKIQSVYAAKIQSVKGHFEISRTDSKVGDPSRFCTFSDFFRFLTPTRYGTCCNPPGYTGVHCTILHHVH
jgi:hypothetical protein